MKMSGKPIRTQKEKAKVSRRKGTNYRRLEAAMRWKRGFVLVRLSKRSPSSWVDTVEETDKINMTAKFLSKKEKLAILLSYSDGRMNYTADCYILQVANFHANRRKETSTAVLPCRWSGVNDACIFLLYFCSVKFLQRFGLCTAQIWRIFHCVMFIPLFRLFIVEKHKTIARCLIPAHSHLILLFRDFSIAAAQFECLLKSEIHEII